MGSKRLYDYIDNNPFFEFYPTEYVNDVNIISQHDKMVGINTGLEIDLTGQVCADSLGHKFYSGIGGQVDFIRGSARSRGGKAVIAMPSTAKNGQISRIVPNLTEGAGVVTTRADVHYVVTEYGIAYLHGKSIRQRVLDLINMPIRNSQRPDPGGKPRTISTRIRSSLSGDRLNYRRNWSITPPCGTNGDLLSTDQAGRPKPGLSEMLYSLSEHRFGLAT